MNIHIGNFVFGLSSTIQYCWTKNIHAIVIFAVGIRVKIFSLTISTLTRRGGATYTPGGAYTHPHF
jgi:hypothetical protein